MRISDWSSDVCSSDLPESYLSEKNIGLLVLSPSCTHFSAAKGGAPRDMAIRDQAWIAVHLAQPRNPRFRPRTIILEKIGRASFRERVCQYVLISALAVSLIYNINISFFPFFLFLFFF